MQKALDEERLKFGEKAKATTKPEAESSKKADSMYAEVVGINMVDVAESSDGKLLSRKALPDDTEMVTEDHVRNASLVTEDQLQKNIERAYPKAEEDLVDFLNRCKISNTNAMLCPRCSAVFDKEAAKAIEDSQPQTKWKGKRKDNRLKFNFSKRGVPYKDHSAGNSQKRNWRGTFNPSAKSPTDTWVFSGGRKSGKQPMTRTQWRRYQRQKKATALQDITNVDKGEGKQKAVFEMVKKPATERISPPLSILKKEHPKEDEEMTSNFTGSDPSLDIVCNVVSILPVEYDVQSEINEVESDFVDEMAIHKPLCYYVMNNGCVEEQHAVFEKPDTSMKSHLKPLFIQAKINGVGVNKVLVDGGATVNLLPQSFLGKIGVYDFDLKPRNVILTNYEGTSGNSLGAIELELVV
ncbi:hypothetical protein MTR_0319s0030, partial [Medicago truncatula]